MIVMVLSQYHSFFLRIMFECVRVWRVNYGVDIVRVDWLVGCSHSGGLQRRSTIEITRRTD